MKKEAEINTMCPFCKKQRAVRVPFDGYIKYREGMLVQKAFPTLSADDREALITGICSDCFPSE